MGKKEVTVTFERYQLQSIKVQVPDGLSESTTNELAQDLARRKLKARGWKTDAEGVVPEENAKEEAQ